MEPDYITVKQKTLYERVGFHFQETVIAGGMRGFFGGVRPDGKLIVNHPARECPKEWNVKFWKVVDYDPKDVQHTESK
jgi:hypothetical protein